MNEELERRLDKIAEILWCEKIQRSDGSVVYLLPGYAGSKIDLTIRLKKLDAHVQLEQQISKTDGFKEGNAAPTAVKR